MQSFRDGDSMVDNHIEKITSTVAACMLLLILICANAAMAVTRNVSGGGNALDVALTEATSTNIIDTILITDATSKTYILNAYQSKTLGYTLYIIGQQTDPDNFPIIVKTQSDHYYNFLSKNSVIFENLIFEGATSTGDYVFNNGQASGKTLGFRNCVIRNIKATQYFLFMSGGDVNTTFFENCLFHDNAILFRTQYWGGTPVLKFVNCTFDTNEEILYSQNFANTSGVSFVNSILTSNTALFTNIDLRSKITHSLTDVASGFGSNCVYSADPQYIEAMRTLPSHFRIGYTSPAKSMGTVTGAPTTDIAGNLRAATPGVGCWIAAIPTFLENYLTWDVAADAAVQSGSGTWGVDDYWTTDGVTLEPWAAGGSAYFGGEEGTFSITVDGMQSVDTMRFGTSGYTLSDGILESSGPVFVNAGRTATISASLSGTSGISYNGGTLTISGANTYTGATTVKTGMLNIRNNAALGDVADGTSVTSGASLELQGGITVNEPLTINGSGISSSGALRSVSGTNTWGGTISVPTASTIKVDGDLAINGIVSGAGAITKSGNAVLTLNAANTHSGAFTVSAGQVTLAHASALGTTAGTTTVGNGASLVIDGSTSGLTISEPVNIRGTGMGSAGALQFATGTATSATWSGAITMAAASSIGVAQVGDTLKVTGDIGGAFSLTKAGAGLLILVANNTYTGTTSVSAGKLQIGNGGATGSIGAAVALSSGTELIVNRTGSLTIGGIISGAGALTKKGAGTLVLTGANTYSGGTTVSEGTVQIGNNGTTGIVAGNITNNGTLVFNRSNAVPFAGNISGTGSLTKQGAGALTLSGTNAYSGATTISAGSLLITGSKSGVGAVTVAGTATLAGTGSVAGKVTVQSGGTLSGTLTCSDTVSIAAGGILSPGGAAAGTIKTGRLSLGNTSVLDFDIGTASDSVAVTGNIILDGTINIIEGAGFQMGTYNIMACTGTITNNNVTIGTTPTDTLQYRVIVQGKQVQLVVSDEIPVSNPVEVTGLRIDNTHIQLSIRGYSDLPTDPLALTSYADTIGIWHKYGSFFATPNPGTAASSLLKLSIDKMKADFPTEPFLDTITVAAATTEDFYFVCGSAFWYDATAGEDSIPPFANPGQGDSIFMVDPATLMNNPLSVTAVKISSSQVKLTIDGQMTLPSVPDPFRPYSDSIGVYYRYRSFYTSPVAGANIFKFKTSFVKTRAPFDTIIDVGTSLNPADSFYYFNATPFWITPPDLAASVPYDTMSPGDSVYMPDPYFAENDLALQGTKISPDSVEISIFNFSTLPNQPVSYKPYVDSIGVWYSYDGYPENGLWDDANMFRFSLTDMKAGPEPFKARVKIPAFVPGSTDSSCYFTSTSHWVWNPDSLLPVVVSKGCSVTMAEVRIPFNSCSITAVQPNVFQDTVIVTVSVDSLDDLADSIYTFYSFTAPANFDPFFVHKIAVSEITGDSYSFKLGNPGFVGETDTVFTASIVVGVHKKNSPPLNGNFTVGRDRPVNTIANLKAEALGPSVIRLTWDAITGVDSIYLFSSGDDIGKGRYAPSTFTVKLPAAETTYEFTGLESLKLYYFGMALVDKGLISDVTDNAIASATTKDSNPNDYLKNFIVIDTSYYVDSNFSFRVKYHLSDEIFEPLQYGYQISFNPNSPIEPQDSGTLSPADSFFTLSLGNTIQFDTTYYIVMTMGKEGYWTAATVASKDTVRIGPFNRQPIKYPSANQTVNANNGKIILKSETSWQGIAYDTVVVFTGGDLDGFVPVSDGFSFKKGDFSPQFNVGLKADAIPSGLSIKDARMYRWQEGKGWTVAESKIDSVSRIISSSVRLSSPPSPFRLLIDTSRVQCEVLSNVTTTVQAGLAISDTFQISDNIINVTASLLYSKADDIFTSPVVQTLSATSGKVTFTIPATAVQPLLGVRAMLVVSDGRNIDTINISRTVRSKNYVVPTVSRKWVPFHSNVKLDSVSSYRALAMLGGQDTEFKYDIKKFRLFRWFKTADNANTSRKWVEYSETDKDSFNLVPGRLMWLKVDKTTSIDLGASVTHSLKDTFTMVLPPLEWTDLVLPYKFPIRIADIIAATGSSYKQLAFYEWQANDSGVYNAELIFATGMGGQLSDSTREMKGSIADAYTIRNYSSSPITLKIPPTLSLLSKYLPKARKVASSENDFWYVTVKSRTAENPKLASVSAGYSTLAKTLDVAPSFGNVSVSLMDRNTGKPYGYMFTPDFSQGGNTFTLRFTNEGTQKTTVYFSAEKSQWVPEGTSVVFVKAATGELMQGSAEKSISLDAQSAEDVIMVVGSSEYIQKAGATADQMKFVFGGLNVNSRAKSVRFNYYAPFAGVNNMEFTIIDMKGRVVWCGRQTVRPSAWNTYDWNGKSFSGSKVSAGTYLVRVKALNAKGRTVDVVDRKMMFVP